MYKLVEVKDLTHGWVILTNFISDGVLDECFQNSETLKLQILKFCTHVTANRKEYCNQNVCYFIIYYSNKVVSNLY